MRTSQEGNDSQADDDDSLGIAFCHYAFVSIKPDKVFGGMFPSAIEYDGEMYFRVIGLIMEGRKRLSAASFGNWIIGSLEVGIPVSAYERQRFSKGINSNVYQHIQCECEGL